MTTEIFKRYLAIDFGKKRIGLATGGIFPTGNGVIDASKGQEHTLDEIQRICDAEDIYEIVMGLPLRSKGEPGTHEEEIKQLGSQIEKKTGRRVIYENEQFTSTESERLLKEFGKKFQRKSGEIDEMSAILLLEQFLRHEK